MALLSSGERSRLDDAARAGWLYYVAGNTQDEIARKLNVSRPTAQRLVSLALSERLISFRLDHPIAACMELARTLGEIYGLAYCDVVPSDPDTPDAVNGVGKAAAAFLEQTLRLADPQIIALGTGRTLRAAVDEVLRIECPHHQLVSLVGNISPSGEAGFFDVLNKLAELTQARHYPMPLPVVASTPEERELLMNLDPVVRVRALADRADLTLSGIGQVDVHAQMYRDGFITREDRDELMACGAVGEIAGWVFDGEGRLLEASTNLRVTSVRPVVPPRGRSVGVAAGPGKVGPVHAALKGRLVNGLITDERTAAALIALANKG